MKNYGVTSLVTPVFMLLFDRLYSLLVYRGVVVGGGIIYKLALLGKA